MTRRFGANSQAIGDYTMNRANRIAIRIGAKILRRHAMQIRFNTAALMGALMVLMMPAFAVLAADHQPPGPQPVERTLLASGLMGTIGSTIGPDGALYVAEGALGRITRIDRSSGKATTFATGLPAAVPGVGIGGPIYVALVRNTAYVLSAPVECDVGGKPQADISTGG